MPYTALARSALRRSLVTRLLAPGTFDRGTVASGGASSAVLTDLAYKYPNGHFDGGDIVLRAGTATAEIRHVDVYTGATGALTVIPAWTTAPVALDAYEIYLSGHSPDLMNRAINDAVSASHMKWPVPAVDYQIVGENARLFPIPSTWVSVNRVMAGSRYIGGDSHGPSGNSSYSTEKTITATTQRKAQMVQFGEQVRWGEIWLPLRRIGTVTGTFAIKIYSSTSDLPGTILAPFGTSDNFTASGIDREMFWQRITFTSPPVTDALTDYHFELDPTSLVGLDASNYLAWGASTDQGYAWGGPSISTDSGSTYTAETGYDRWFKIVSTAPKFEKIPWRSWRVIKSPVRNLEMKYDLPIMTPVRLEGQKWQASLDLDTDTCLLPENWILDIASYSYLMNASTGGDGALQLARERAQRAAEFLATTPVIVQDRFVEPF